MACFTIVANTILHHTVRLTAVTNVFVQAMVIMGVVFWLLESSQGSATAHTIARVVDSLVGRKKERVQSMYIIQLHTECISHTSISSSRVSTGRRPIEKEKRRIRRDRSPTSRYHGVPTTTLTYNWDSYISLTNLDQVIKHNQYNTGLAGQKVNNNSENCPASAFTK